MKDLIKWYSYICYLFMHPFRYRSFRSLLCIALIGSLHLQGIVLYLVSAKMIMDSSALIPATEAREYVVSGTKADQGDSERSIAGSPLNAPQPVSEEERAESEQSDTTKTIMIADQSDDATLIRDAAFNTFAVTIQYCIVFTPPPEVA